MMTHYMEILVKMNSQERAIPRNITLCSGLGQCQESSFLGSIKAYFSDLRQCQAAQPALAVDRLRRARSWRF